MCLRNLASFCFEPDENTIRTSKQLANVPGLADRSVRRRPKRWIKGHKGLGYEGHLGFGRQVQWETSLMGRQVQWETSPTGDKSNVWAN